MSRIRKIIGAAIVVTLTSIFVAAWHLHHDLEVWSPDGALYLRMAMQARGVPADSALEASNRFMLEKFDHRTDLYNLLDLSQRIFYTDRSPRFYVDQFALFQNRPLYPRLSAVLYPKFGPASLKIVSAAAYVLAVVAMFALLLQMTSPLRAALGALVFASEQVVLNPLAMATTDELALLFWTCALCGIIAYQRRPRLITLVAFCLTSVALTLTRPAFFLPLGAAVGAYYVMRGSHRRMIACAPLMAAASVGFMYFAYTASIHGPSVLAQLHWEYAWQRSIHAFGADHGPMVWYLSALLRCAYQAMLIVVPYLGGIILILLALLGTRSYFENGPARIAIVSAMAIAVAIFVNPVDLERPVLLPMAPLVVMLSVVGFERLSAAAALSGATSAGWKRLKLLWARLAKPGKRSLPAIKTTGKRLPAINLNAQRGAPGLQEARSPGPAR